MSAGAIGGLHTQRGQAITEFIVVAVTVLIPLFLIIPVVAKLISMKQDVELGARYAAWERTVWYRDGADAGKDDSEVARQIDERVFAPAAAVIRSSAVDDPALDPFMTLNRQVAGRMQALPKDDGDERYASQVSDETEPEAVAGVIDDFIGMIGHIGSFKLPRGGLYTAELTVPLIDLSGYFGGKLGVETLNLQRSNTLFTESWTVGGNQQARKIISGLVPQKILDNPVVGTLQSLGPLVGVAEELGPDYLDFGHVDIDPLPAHRLSDYGTP